MGQEAVLLTPLASSHRRSLPPRHLINRVNPSFCKKPTFLFSCACRMPFQQLLSFQIHACNGGYREHMIQTKDLPIPLSPLGATLTTMRLSVDSEGIETRLSLLDATLTKNMGGGASPSPKLSAASCFLQCGALTSTLALKRKRRVHSCLIFHPNCSRWDSSGTLPFFFRPLATRPRTRWPRRSAVTTPPSSAVKSRSIPSRTSSGNLGAWSSFRSYLSSSTSPSSVGLARRTTRNGSAGILGVRHGWPLPVR